MSDKERIERLLQTLMHVKQCLHFLNEMTMTFNQPEVDRSIKTIRETIEFVISQNADQINLDL